MLPNKDNQRARLQTAPQTNRGLLELYRRKAARLFCTTHALQHVAAVASRCWSFRTGKDIEGALRQFLGEQ